MGRSGEFFKDKEKEAEYVRRFEEKRKKLLADFPQYAEILHDEMLKQITRSELVCEIYESDLANNNENAATFKLLREERNHLRTLWDSMLISLRSLKESEEKKRDEFTVVIIQNMTDALEKALMDEDMTTRSRILGKLRETIKPALPPAYENK